MKHHLLLALAMSLALWGCDKTYARQNSSSTQADAEDNSLDAQLDLPQDAKDQPDGPDLAPPDLPPDDTEAQCSTPNPAGCTQEGCPEGYLCLPNFEECAPSECQCIDGNWGCTRDCGGGGTCAPEPEPLCPDTAPVCGVDGQTWADRCAAESNGVEVFGQGTCEALCAVIGPCMEDPVCGADGRTWSCAQEAICAGTGVLHRGACEQVCGADEDCDPGSFCDLRDNTCTTACELCDGAWPVCTSNGTQLCPEMALARGFDWPDLESGACPGDTGAACAQDEDCGCHEACFEGECRPATCAGRGEPWCDAQGRTWRNLCDAQLGLAPLSYRGQCRESRGCSHWGDCGPELVCRTDTQTCQRPCGQDVDCDAFGPPICGQDGRIYGCEAHAACAGVPRSEDPDLCSEEQPGLCFEDAQCPEGMLCEQGRCLDFACPPVYEPRCGVDGRTYGDECSLRLARTQEAYPLECGAWEGLQSCQDVERVFYALLRNGECQQDSDCRVQDQGNECSTAVNANAPREGFEALLRVNDELGCVLFELCDQPTPRGAACVAGSCALVY